MIYANEFKEILTALSDNKELRARVLIMIQTKPLCIEVVEEEERASEFRNILVDLVNGDISNLAGSYKKIGERIPEANSKYKNNGEIFHKGWEEVLMKMQLSRFYNNAVLKELAENGSEECIIAEASVASNCILGQNNKYKVRELMESMVNYFDLGYKDTVLKIPEHPDCPHVVKPLEFEHFARN